MIKEMAKEYIYRSKCSRKIYVSKDLERLMIMNEGDLAFIYAVLDTDNGEMLMHMDWSYSEEAIIMGRYLHKAFFLRYYSDYKVIYLDK